MPIPNDNNRIKFLSNRDIILLKLSILYNYLKCQKDSYIHQNYCSY